MVRFDLVEVPTVSPIRGVLYKNLQIFDLSINTFFFGKSEMYRTSFSALSSNLYSRPTVTLLHYITLHKIVFRVPKITRTTRTLYEIKGVIWSTVMRENI